MEPARYPVLGPRHLHPAGQGLRRFDAPIVSIKGDGFNLLGDHFHPLLVILGPAYAFFPSGLTLLILQNILIGLSVLVIARLGIRRLGTVAGSCLGVATDCRGVFRRRWPRSSTRSRSPSCFLRSLLSR
ncbi:hypothetical protein DDA93_07415 [Arthrobacter sp. Bz4]|nr:hypothetical protein DDA93_07415 [Arthrobacter sp. Bz4]